MVQRFRNDQVLAHRGLWNPNLTGNSVGALQKAARFGFGIETDLRNDSRGVWVAHDVIDLDEKIQASQILGFGVPVALNVKSDGLCSFGLDHLSQILATRSFFFDGSIPQMLEFKRKSIPHALRLSEYEVSLPWTPDYVWLDSFESDWWVSELSLFEIYPNPIFVIVSPELHGRNPNSMWDKIYQLDSAIENRIMICTDRPVEFVQWGQ